MYGPNIGIIPNTTHLRTIWTEDINQFFSTLHPAVELVIHTCTWFRR